MAVIRWNPGNAPFETLRDLRQEVDRLFEGFCGSSSKPWSSCRPAPGGRPFVPSVDVKETENDYLVSAEVPGMTREELDVEINPDSVTIKGERRQEQTRSGESYRYRESTYGSFQRVVPLPGPVRPDLATAVLRDGVLTLTLPKAEPPKQVGIKVSLG